jgi:hypothetical protein
MNKETYIGDGVYAGFDGYQVWIWTQEGSKIALEKDVMISLLIYAEQFYVPLETQQ